MRPLRETSWPWRRPGFPRNGWSNQCSRRRWQRRLRPREDFPPRESRIDCETSPLLGSGHPQALKKLIEEGSKCVRWTKGQESPKRYWPNGRGGKTGKDAGRMVGLREGGGAVADGFFSEEGLLTDAGGDFGKF